jgi:tetratricopeptide (TPR) repeat protein
MIAIILIFLFSTVVLGDESVIIDEYIEIIENRRLTQEDIDNLGQDNEALVYFLDARLLLYDYKYEQAYSKLENALLISKDDRLTLEIQYYLAELDRAFYKVSSMLNRVNEAKILAERLDITKRLADIDVLLAYTYSDAYADNEAIKFAEQGIKRSQSVAYSYGESKAYLLLSDINYYQSDFEQMKKNIENARLAVEGKFVNSVVGDFHLELDFYELDAKNITGDLDDLTSTFMSLIEKINPEDAFSLSYIYQYLGGYFYDLDTEKAIEYYEKSL